MLNETPAASELTRESAAKAPEPSAFHLELAEQQFEPHGRGGGGGGGGGFPRPEPPRPEPPRPEPPRPQPPRPEPPRPQPPRQNLQDRSLQDRSLQDRSLQDRSLQDQNSKTGTSKTSLQDRSLVQDRILIHQILSTWIPSWTSIPSPDGDRWVGMILIVERGWDPWFSNKIRTWINGETRSEAKGSTLRSDSIWVMPRAQLTNLQEISTR